MKKLNIQVYGRINERYRKYVVAAILTAFIFSAVLTFFAIRQPLHIEEKIITNNIEEKTSFDYKAKVVPSTLYPNGGIITPDKVVFNNLTEDFIVSINSTVNTHKAVRIEAINEVSYNLAAEKMWEREFILRQPISYNSEGTVHQLLNEEAHININEINSFIAKVEEETLVRPNYSIVVKSKVTGQVYDENNNAIYIINNILEIPFSLSGQYISYAGETEGKEFINTESIEQVNIIPQSFNLFGMNLSVINSRMGFGTASVILLILLIIYGLEKLSNKVSLLTEISVIDKKGRGNIVAIENKLKTESMINITVKSFKDLLKIAEEKDESILRYFDLSIGVVYYYISSSSYIYIYKCRNAVKGSEQIQDA